MKRTPTQNGSGLVLPGAHRACAKGRVYWYAWRGGPQLWSGRIEDEADAALEIAQAYIDTRKGTPAEGTIARLVSEYLQSAEFAGHAPRTRELYHQYLSAAKERLGALNIAEFGGRKGRALIRTWRDELTPRCADQVLTVVGALASWGRQADKLPPNCKPTADLGKRYHAPPQRAWTQAELDLAMSSLPPHLANVIALAYNTGLRRADLVALTWAAVDEAKGVLRWHTSKGKKRRRLAIVKLTPALRATLRRIPRGDAVTILTNSHGTPWTPRSVSSALQKALAPLGIDSRLHGLRRLCATQLAAQGLSSRQIARQMGWSEREAEEMTAVYIDDEAVIAEQERDAL